MVAATAVNIVPIKFNITKGTNLVRAYALMEYDITMPILKMKFRSPKTIVAIGQIKASTIKLKVSIVMLSR